MRIADEKREIIINNFLDWCEKIRFSDPDNPIRIEIIDGLPIAAKRPVQSIRFDINLTKSKQNTTME